MIIYGIAVTRQFTDAITGVFVESGSIFETTGQSRALNIINRGYGKLKYAMPVGYGHKYDVIFHQNVCYLIGGIETANRNIARAFGAKYKIAFVFRSANLYQAFEIARYCAVIIDEPKATYSCNVLVLCNFDSGPLILDRVNCKKVYQQIHADWTSLKASNPSIWSSFEFKPDPRIDAIACVSDTSKKSMRKEFGLDACIVPNILLDQDDRMVFICLSRASKEKGMDRVADLIERIKREQPERKFVMVLASTIEQVDQDLALLDRLRSIPEVIFVTPSVMSTCLLRAADYLVQLSTSESYSYSVREALSAGVPVLGSDLPELRKVIKNGENGYLIGNIEDVDINAIFDKKPVIKTKYSEPIPKVWTDVLEGKL